MTYPVRNQSESGFYHVICRGVGRQIIFEDDDDRTCFLRLLASGMKHTNTELYAWCLMDNHAHLLIRDEGNHLSELMRLVLGKYARYFNGRHERVGHLFQGRFKSEPIDSEEYLLSVIRYIHQNPAKAGMGTVEGYRWSSYRSYVAGDSLVKTELVLDLLGGRQGFERFHQVDGPDEFEEASDTRAESLIKRSRRLAERVLDGIQLNSVGRLPRAERDRAIALLRQEGLSIRQIERLTGIGRGIVASIHPKDFDDLEVRTAVANRCDGGGRDESQPLP